MTGRKRSDTRYTTRWTKVTPHPLSKYETKKKVTRKVNSKAREKVTFKACRWRQKLPLKQLQGRGLKVTRKLLPTEPKLNTQTYQYKAEKRSHT